MKERRLKMKSEAFQRAQTFMWNNARLLERQLFGCLFTGGDAQGVVKALKAYQNPDGGFGHGLEPDKRSPESQPVDVEQALHLLDRVGAFQEPQLSELVLPACDFLASISTPEGGVPFALPSVKKYPHAPWWEIEDHPPASLNPTAGIVALLLKHGVEHPWIDRAAAFCWEAIRTSETEWYHDLMPVIGFLQHGFMQHSREREQAEIELNRITTRISRPGVIEMDPQAGGYVKKPLDWAPTPNSYCRRMFDDVTIDRHLSALAGRQMEDGGWPINWDAISPGVELEWRGLVTIEALWTLRAYGRID
jgi:hypothetical protein